MKKEEYTSFIGCYVPDSLAEWVKKKAKSESRTVTGYIINLLKEQKNGKA